MKKTLFASAAILMVSLVSGCTNTIDASSAEALRDSERKIVNAMDTERSIFFERSRDYLVSQKGMDDYRIFADGMTGEEVIDAAMDLELTEHKKTVAELKQKYDDSKAIEERIANIEFISYDSVRTPKTSTTRAFDTNSVTVRNNSGVDIYGFSFSGDFDYLMTEEQSVKNQSIPYVAGEYGFRFNNVEIVFNKGAEPIKNGQEHTYTSNNSTSHFRSSWATPSNSLLDFVTGGEFVRQDVKITKYVAKDDEGDYVWIEPDHMIEYKQKAYEDALAKKSVITKEDLTDA